MQSQNIYGFRLYDTTLDNTNLHANFFLLAPNRKRLALLLYREYTARACASLIMSKKMEEKYPLMRAAARKHRDAQWLLGDAALAECGAPSSNGKNDGSLQKLKEAQEIIFKEEHFEITLNTLLRYREIAYKFPKDKRRNVCWSHHCDAGSPEALDGVIAAVDGEKNVTRDIIRKQKAKYKKEEMTTPRKDEVRTSVGELGLELLIANAKGSAEKVRRMLEKGKVHHLSENTAMALIEEVSELQSNCHEIIRLLQSCKNILNSEKHLDKTKTVLPLKKQL